MIALALVETGAQASQPGRPGRSIIAEAIEAWRAAGSPQSQPSQEGAYWVAEAVVAYRAENQEPSGDWTGGRHG